MKSIYVLLLPLLFAALSSCNAKTEATISNSSPNGKVQVKITAKRGNTFDAFKTDIEVKAYDFQKGKLSFEIMAGDLNQQNVSFKWTDDNNCIITIEENDKHVRSFQLLANENQVQLGEIGASI